MVSSLKKYIEEGKVEGTSFRSVVFNLCSEERLDSLWFLSEAARGKRWVPSGLTYPTSIEHFYIYWFSPEDSHKIDFNKGLHGSKLVWETPEII